MKTDSKGRWLAVILLLTMMLGGCAPQGQAEKQDLQEQVGEAIKQGCVFLDQKQGDFTLRNETTDQDAYLLAQAGRMTNEQKTAYLHALAKAISEGATFNKVTGWQDVIFGVAACGGDPRDVNGVDFLAKAMSYDPISGENYVDFYVLTNLLLISGNVVEEAPFAAEIMTQVMAGQNRDGAFVDDWGTTLDATILALQALALYQEQGGEEFALAVDRAVVYLSQSQDKGGYFNYSGEPSISSTAQGIIALVGLGIDPVGDQRFVSRDGEMISGLLHLYNKELAKGAQADYFNVTEGLMGLVAYERWLGGEDYYYQLALPRVKEAEPKTPQADNPQGVAKEAKPAEGKPEAAQDELSKTDEAKGAEPAEALAEEVTLTITGPEDVGTILSVNVALEADDTVYSVLRRATKEAKIPVESSGGEKKAYIEGINNIYEFDHGATSGWLYSVDGLFPNKSSGGYALTKGQSVQWVYTLNMGQDVGAPANSGQGQ